MRDIEKHRSKRSQTIDEKKVNATVIPPDSPLTAKWAEHPGRLDVAGIDAPAKTPITIKTEGGHWEKINGKYRFIKNNVQTYTTGRRSGMSMSGLPKFNQAEKGKKMAKPPLSVKREGRLIKIKGVGLASRMPKGRIARKK